MDLKAEQKRTLDSARLNYDIMPRILFWLMDLFYGKKRTLIKFKILELLARLPYQAWEREAYRKISRTYSDLKGSHHTHKFLQETRAQQDNEQWHLLIIEELIQKMGIKQNYIYHCLLPQIAALIYHIPYCLMYKISPKGSFKFNVFFEDHAEHEYMHLVEENPQFDDMKFDSSFKANYGEYETYGDVFRRIGVDEREHKEESQKYIKMMEKSTSI